MRFELKLPYLTFAAAFTALCFSVPSLAADKEGDPPAEKPGAALAEKPGPKDGERGKRGPEDVGGAKKPEAGGAPAQGKGLNTKEGKVFVAYDKDRSGAVSDEEIVAMMEGKQNSRGRREVRKAIDRADKDGDDVLNFDEFLWWYKVGRLDERAKNRE
ncbi:EF-hand domain-containing protein [Verrucomicrobiales bacterium]|nr:EF-hand domain-containing protein [Verrucomicrobiales bacterium]